MNDALLKDAVHYLHSVGEAYNNGFRDAEESLQDELAAVKAQRDALAVASRAALDALDELIGADYDLSGEQAMLRQALATLEDDK